jgi:protein TonB
MAVQIINFMPDSEVHRGDPVELLRALERPRSSDWLRARFTGRAGFAFATIALHVIALVAFVNAQHHERVLPEAEPLMASLLDAPAPQAEAPREYTPPLVNVTLAVPVPQDVSFETDAITPDVMPVADATPSQGGAPMVVESVEYVRAPAPVYPSESNRKRERGIVLLRVVVDTLGRPAQIQIERSSGYVRLDSAAREAVEKALFRPYEVNGVAQPAQVLIPIEFTRRAS